MKTLRKHKSMYLLLFPGLLYLLLFKYAPMFGVVIAFKQFNLSDGIWGSPWIGFDNFKRFFDGVYFSQIMSNTVLISLYKLLFGFPAPIILALMLNEIRIQWFKRLIQSVSYIPHFISWVIIYGLLIAFLSPGEGLINILLRNAGFHGISFLTEPNWIRSLIVASDIWHEVGWGAIIYLAALTGIDTSLYEAARVDGAARWKQLWHVTLPGLSAVIILMLLLRLGKVLDVGFDQIFMMSNVFNREKSDIIETWVYRVGLQELQLGLASAVGLFKSVIGFILILTANQLAKKFDGQIW